MDVLIVDDDKSVRDSTLLAVESDEHYAEAVPSGEMALQRLKEDPFQLVFLDLNLGVENGMDILEKIKASHPELPVVIFTAEASIASAVKATQLGALDYLEKPFTLSQLRRVIANSQRSRKLETKIEELRERVATNSPKEDFEVRDPAAQKALDVLWRAAATPVSILIQGESGTGKSVVARAVHERSQRRDKPFVTVSCPSLSKELFESDLFGHVKGSFTGAVKDHWGKVKAAEGGTLFLDEIGELPMEIQPKLLRLLQEQEYERVGENKSRRADLRFIAATNRDLQLQIAEGKFREDLFYRLNVIAVTMPPLRERPQDLVFFAESYVSHFAQQCGRKIRGFSKDGIKALREYPWPGNLRELRNTIERAVILSNGTEITAEDLPCGSAKKGCTALVPGAKITLHELEAEHIQRILSSTGSLHEAAAILGIDQATLYRKRKKSMAENLPFQLGDPRPAELSGT